MSDKAKLGDWLACDKIEVLACCNIWFLVKLALSVATSTLRIRDSAELRFSILTDKLDKELSRRLLNAPKVARLVFKLPKAVSKVPKKA
jgi:hypothetical protein